MKRLGLINGVNFRELSAIKPLKLDISEKLFVVGNHCERLFNG